LNPFPYVEHRNWTAKASQNQLICVKIRLYRERSRGK
jgi:hypothetical protein